MFGPPGSGKGTYASRLSTKLNTPHISTGDLVREEVKNQTEIGKRVNEYQARGQLVPDSMICQLLQKRIAQPDCKDGFILDGFPRTIPQAQELEKISTTDLVINLDVPDEVIIQRLSTRLICKKCGSIYNERTLKPRREGRCDKCDGDLYKREDDRPNVVQYRLEIYRKQTQPLLEYYKKKNQIRNISNKQSDVPPERVVEEIIKVIHTSIA
ncbi:MAG TPA: adenylate kinase [Terriglobales bacterium]|nr:adenylate kinase [Terriglobales bacterium]